MTRLLEENKSLVWLTAGILTALVAALAAAMGYFQHHPNHIGKGSGGLVVVAVLYTPAFALAATLMLRLCFNHSLWRLLFFIALAVNLVVLLLTIALGIRLNSSEVAHQPTSFLGYLNGFPFFCNILLVLIFFRRQ